MSNRDPREHRRRLTRGKVIVIALAFAILGGSAYAVATGPASNGTIGGHARKSADKPGEEGADSVALRRRATNEWYGDGRIPLNSRRGPFSETYRRFLVHASEREEQRYPALLPPRSGSAPAAGTSEASPLSGASIPAWLNLGPTSATCEKNGGITLSVTDSGRVRSIIVQGSVIYVASAG